MKHDFAILIGVLALGALLGFVDHEVTKLGRHLERAACLHHHAISECKAVAP